jgi:phosphoglycolate phosphatase
VSRVPPATDDPAPIRRPRAILFDWDNTLVDSWGTIHEARNFVLGAMGHELRSLADTKQSARLSLRDDFPTIFGDRWEEARTIYLGKVRAIHLERLTPLRGREAMLRALAEQGVYLGVVSNKVGDLLRREVDRLGWSVFFRSIVGAGDAAADKPACEPVHLALEGSGLVASEEVWFVGDTAVDMECAIKSGCVPVLLGEGEGTPEFARFAPRLSFADETGFFRLLEGLRFGATRPSS